MPASVSMNADVTVDNTPFSFSWSGSYSHVPVNRGMGSPVHYLTDTAENITKGECQSPGVVILHNITSIGGNTIYWGKNVGGNLEVLGYIPPGGFAVFQLYTGVQLMARAASALGALLQPYFIEA